MDPLLDFIRLLRPQATLWARVHGFGDWALSFPSKDDLLFCWLEEGQCQLLRSGTEPITLRKDDFVLIRTTVPFTCLLKNELATHRQWLG